jgi:predicted MFS family arabinose efflux permease
VPRTLQNHVGRNLELYLMAFSVAIALGIPLAIEIGTNEQELAITALAACVFQGVVFWLLRRRYRRVRGEMITELRAMLKDRINNHLTIVLMSVTQHRESTSSTERELLEAAIAATAAVSRVLEDMSMESLRSWKAKYRLDDPSIAAARFPRGQAGSLR